MRLYCFPPAGGTRLLYRAWNDLLSPVVEVRVARYHHGGGRPSVQDLAEACADTLDETASVGFFGHSMGALVAYETARALSARGRRGPDLLFVSGHVAPQLPTPGHNLHQLPTEEFWAEIRALGGTGPDLIDDPDLRSAVEPRLRAEFRAAETYRYVPGWPLHCDVVGLAGSADPRAPVAYVSGWRIYTTGSFTLEVLPGGHFFLDDWRDDVLRLIRTTVSAAARR